MKYNKKAQMGGAVGSLIGLIVGVGIATLVMIFMSSLGGQTYNLVEQDITDIGNKSIVGGAFTALNGSDTYIGNAPIHSGSVAIYNATSSANIGIGNFSIDYDQGLIRLSGEALTQYTNQALGINYTYGDTEIRGYIKDAITASFKAQKTTGNYIPLIVLAVIISLVLFLILGIAE